MKANTIRLLPLLLMAVALHSNAAVQFQFVNIVQSGPGGASLALESIDPFDASLGTLDKVQMNLSGNLAVSGIYTENMVWGSNPAPVPYPVFFKVDHYLDGLIGFSGFHFNAPATYNFISVAPGILGNPYLLSKAFSYDVTFDNASDLIGFALPTNVSGPSTPPVTISGLRDDFLNPNSLLKSTLLTEDFSGRPNIPTTSLQATLWITYEYTPNQPGGTIPEPSSLALLGLALTGLAASYRRIKS